MNIRMPFVEKPCSHLKYPLRTLPVQRYVTSASVQFILLFICMQLNAQDLDPRAYLRVPVHTNTLVAGYSLSKGGIVTDPALSISNLEATVQTASIAYVNSFNFFGMTAQAMAVVPYSWATVEGEVIGQQQSISRSGFSDSRLRLTVLVHGAPAVSLSEFVKANQKTIIGVSLNMIVPTGQFYSDKLINLGTNRFSFRPEIAISKPFMSRWLVDLYAGVWLFTKNNSFYPGDAVRKQEPMGSFQFHLSYNIKPRMWMALNATYYVGGVSSINDTYNDDRQSNSRIGATVVFPVRKYNSVKISMNTGAVVRIGQDFSTVSIGWQRSWIAKEKTKH